MPRRWTGPIKPYSSIFITLEINILFITIITDAYPATIILITVIIPYIHFIIYLHIYIKKKSSSLKCLWLAKMAAASTSLPGAGLLGGLRGRPGAATAHGARGRGRGRGAEGGLPLRQPGRDRPAHARGPSERQGGGQGERSELDVAWRSAVGWWPKDRRQHSGARPHHGAEGLPQELNPRGFRWLPRGPTRESSSLRGPAEPAPALESSESSPFGAFRAVAAHLRTCGGLSALFTLCFGGPRDPQGGSWH